MNLKAFVTDEEAALQKALSKAFPAAVSLMCMTHIIRNLRAEIVDKLHLSNGFYSTVVKDSSGSVEGKGLIHTAIHDEYETLSKLHTKWDDLEKSVNPER